jgi:monovalent cation/hydrogen antiporter
VLAAVTVGLYLAWQSPTGVFQPTSRLQATAFWDVFIFLLESLLFILVGLQLRTVLDELSDRDPATVAGAILAVGATVVLVRLAWMLVMPSVVGRLTRARDYPSTPLPERLLLGWSGMRGAVSMAAALSVPLSVRGRPLIIIVTFAVILITLVGQGLTLPALARRLVPPGDPDDRAEVEARAAAARAALEELDRAAEREEVPEDDLRYARRRYEMRLRHLDADSDERALPAMRDLQRRLVERERETIERLHAEDRLDQATTRRLERELDLQEERWSDLEESTLG